MSEDKCKFYKEVFCEPCKSPDDFDDCPLVKIGMQIVLDNFIEGIPESKKIDYVTLDFYLHNLEKQKENLISEFVGDLNIIRKNEPSDEITDATIAVDWFIKKWEKRAK